MSRASDYENAEARTKSDQLQGLGSIVTRMAGRAGWLRPLSNTKESRDDEQHDDRTGKIEQFHSVALILVVVIFRDDP
ncbi:MAG TPA: hypothetical protein VME45_03010 [Stellaceae bacterium]|nr:hypothetical protein [Stellaceae bacterium]